MPYSVGVPGSFPSPREAVLDAIKNQMTAKIGDLNNALAYVSPAVPLGVTLDASHVHIGDIDLLPDPTTAPVWFTIEGGGKQDGRDMRVNLYETGGVDEWIFYSNVYMYCHPEVFPMTSAFAQGETRTRLRARVTDWLLFDVLNTFSAEALTLGSQQFCPSGGIFDVLGWSHIEDVFAGYVLKSFANKTWIFMAHFVHCGKLIGSAG